MWKREARVGTSSVRPRRHTHSRVKTGRIRGLEIRSRVRSPLEVSGAHRPDLGEKHPNKAKAYYDLSCGYSNDTTLLVVAVQVGGHPLTSNLQYIFDIEKRRRRRWRSDSDAHSVVDS